MLRRTLLSLPFAGFFVPKVSKTDTLSPFSVGQLVWVSWWRRGPAEIKEINRNNRYMGGKTLYLVQACERICARYPEGRGAILAVTENQITNL